MIFGDLTPTCVTNLIANFYVLEAGSNLTLPRKCRLLIKSSMGDGVMVYTSAMYLRPGAVTGCVDYVQFGQDDFIPFITYRKSDKEPVQADRINLKTISQLKR